MKKNFRSIKASLIMGILLLSLSAAMVPTTSAGILYSLESYINVNYERSITEKPVIPRSTGRVFHLEIKYGVTVSGGLFNVLGNL